MKKMETPEMRRGSTRAIRWLPTACVAVAVAASCASMRDYTGDGTIKDTSYWEGLGRVRQYTVTLTSFPLSGDAEGEFRLGRVDFFQRTAIVVYLRFNDRWFWFHSKAFKDNRGFDEAHGCQDIDHLHGSLSCTVTADPGAEVLAFDKPFQDLTWNQIAQRDSPLGWNTVRMYDYEGGRGLVPKKPLRLKFSYRGDPSLTNSADLIVTCQPR
jgi:hypothetical protein